MRPTTDLLNLEFVFSQQSPLTPQKFMEAFEQRMITREFRFSDWEQLEELHRIGALVPMFRFDKNVRTLLEKARQSKRLARFVGLGKDTEYVWSQYGSDFGSLADAHTENHKSWYSYIHQYKTDYYWQGKSGQEEIGYYWSSSFLYSHYQVLLIPQLRSLLSKMHMGRTNRKYSSIGFRYRLTLNKRQQEEALKEAAENRDLIIALMAIEAKYLPQLKGHRFSAIYSGTNSFVKELVAYQQSFDPIDMLNWVGWDADKVKKTAENLLWQADRLDPLRDWHKLIRMCHPEMLNKLRGDALVALDHRRAAEMLLRFYEDLQAHGAAPPFAEIPKRYRGSLDTRLKYDLGTLDEILMNFGLSPQPSLVLIIEGDTEEYVVPEVMKLLGIPQYSSFIKIFNSKGVDKDFELLARYITPFQFGDALENAVLLTRPPTHFLVAVDEESNFRNSGARKKEHKKWVAGIYGAVPEEYRTENMREDLSHFVNIETWGDVFEFAHFTDEELGQALLITHKGSESPSLDYLMKEVKRIRERNEKKNIEDVLRKWNYQKEQAEPAYVRGREVGKTDLAIVLWPVLEKKIQNASSENDLNQIPIARVLLKANHLAALAHRKDVVARYK